MQIGKNKVARTRGQYINRPLVGNGPQIHGILSHAVNVPNWHRPHDRETNRSQTNRGQRSTPTHVGRWTQGQRIAPTQRPTHASTRIGQATDQITPIHNAIPNTSGPSPPCSRISLQHAETPQHSMPAAVSPSARSSDQGRDRFTRSRRLVGWCTTGCLRCSKGGKGKSFVSSRVDHSFRAFLRSSLPALYFLVKWSSGRFNRQAFRFNCSRFLAAAPDPRKEGRGGLAVFGSTVVMDSTAIVRELGATLTVPKVTIVMTFT